MTASPLRDHRNALLKFVQHDLLDRITEIASDTRYIHKDLSERLANAGILPMFGFPTRSRTLHLSIPAEPRDLERDKVDRDLDIAISQFAPGSETVKDKTIYTAVGVVDYRPSRQGVSAGDGRGYIRRIEECRKCGFLTLEPTEGELCPVCTSAEYAAVDVWEPIGFTVEPGEHRDYDGRFEWVPRASQARLSSAEAIPTEKVPETNLEVASEFKDILSLNDNDGQKFRFERQGDLWLSPETLRGTWARAGTETCEVALGSMKRTDILLSKLGTIPPELDLDPSGPNRLQVTAAYLSWGSLVRKAACDHMDVHPSELGVNLRVVPPLAETPARVEVFLADTLENGAGYCRHLGQIPNPAVLAPLAEGGRFFKRLVDPDHSNPDPSRDCDSSCYDCLRDFQNANLHGILDWRLGLDLARLALDDSAVPSLRTPYWTDIVRRSAHNLARLRHGTAQVQAGLWVVEVDGHLDLVLHHPLWSSKHPSLASLAKELGIDVTDLPCCSVFDASRRPGWVLARRVPGV